MARDPVCGMIVDRRGGHALVHAGRTYYFCGDYCAKAFVSAPERYLANAVADVGLPERPARTIAYLSMEIGVDPRLATYAGGLGALAGDTLRSFADLGVPVVGVGLLFREGYFCQHLDSNGVQTESPERWEPGPELARLPLQVEVSIAGRPVRVAGWEYEIVGISGQRVPLVLLDTDLLDNALEDRRLTARLYGGDAAYRLSQEIVLGIGGLRMLRALGHTRLRRFHLNEGHASLLALELLREANVGNDPGAWTFEAVREQCVFTTHTPIPAGHDQFPHELVRAVLTEPVPAGLLEMLGGAPRLNMTLLALNLSRYVNGVAKRHGVVSQEMFPAYPIGAITNGVHSRSWTCAAFRALFDRHIPGWAGDPFSLRHAISIPRDEVRAAHALAKAELLAELARRGHDRFGRNVLTIGFARRATPYKRADLVFEDPDRLVAIARQAGPIQLVFAGKAHPHDQGGREIIRRIVAAGARLRDDIAVAYLEDYGIELARLLTAGVDLWLNTPQPPLEASGTSGMKAAHNGIPSLSIPDGWWVEGLIEGVTGWAIGDGTASSHDANDLYHKLHQVIVPMYYQEPERWLDVMRQTIALNASFFNSHRMVQQYVTLAYT